MTFLAPDPDSTFTSPSEVRFGTRLYGLIALSWGVVALVLQLVIVAQAARLPTSVLLLVILPTRGAIRADGVSLATADLLRAEWIVLAAFLLIVVGAMMLASRRRWWLLIVIAVAMEAVSYCAAITFFSVMPHLGAGITIAVVVALVAPLASWILPGLSRRDSTAAQRARDTAELKAARGMDD